MMKPSSTPRPSDWASGCLWAGLGFAGMTIVLLALLWFLPGWTRRAGDVLVPPEMTVLPFAEVDLPSEGTQTPNQTGTPQQPQADEQPSQPKDFLIGQFVQIYGTGGDGLRLRGGPTLGADINLVAAEYEVYEIHDGPADGDGYRWWYLVNPYDEDLEGWAVEQYLEHLTEN